LIRGVDYLKYEKAVDEVVNSVTNLMNLQIDEEGLENKREIIKNLKLIIDDVWDEIEMEG